MESTITILIYIHVCFGGLGLITGVGSIIVKKGSALHKKMGKLFSIGMLTSSLISLPISWMPNHKNLFLFLIGIFTIYLVLAGYRALLFKTKVKANLKDQFISGSMLLASLIMIALGLYGAFNGLWSSSILYLVCGSFGLLLTIQDFKFYNTPKPSKNAWLIIHLGKMNGALIASITAFLVAGLGLVHIITWILPSVLGTFYIIYWKIKISH
ncbi:hypothetical protein A9Q86_02660 [Flavobacteriales bacterium 33_180_T64]|nr:hypothetical protein A9Q86_02660 [Flavobacteriales bacterium 33_180_T64]